MSRKRGWYTNNVYGTAASSTKESWLQLICRDLISCSLHFSFWLFFSIGFWDTVIAPMTGYAPANLLYSAFLLLGFFLGRAVFV